MAILIAMAFLVKGYQSTLSAERWLAHTTQVERQLHGLRESLVRESAEVRAYVFERDSKVFTSLDKTTQEFSSSIATLRGLTRDNPGQQERVDQLERELAIPGGARGTHPGAPGRRTGHGPGRRRGPSGMGRGQGQGPKH